jgi:hypothetical protein
MKLAKFKKQVQTTQKEIDKMEKDSLAEKEKTPKLEQKLAHRQR